MSLQCVNEQFGQFQANVRSILSLVGKPAHGPLVRVWPPCRVAYQPHRFGGALQIEVNAFEVSETGSGAANLEGL